MYTKGLKTEWFNLIKTGEKKYEGRIFVDDWTRIKVGDQITFYNSDEVKKDGKEKKGLVSAFVCTVASLNVFPSFEEAIDSVGLDKVLPSRVKDGTKKAVEDVYRAFYSKEAEKDHGVVLVGLKV